MSRSNVVSRRLAVALVAVAASVVPTASLSAQRPTVARITPYVGYIMFGDFVDGPLGTSVSNESSALFGTALGLDLSPNVALVGNVAYTEGRLEARIPFVGGVSFADSKVLFFDAGLQFRLPTSSLGAGVVPFVEVGAGAIRYEMSLGPLTTDATNFAGNVGAGVDLRISRVVGMRVGVKDYIGKFDVREAITVNVDSKVSHNVGLTAGLNINF